MVANTVRTIYRDRSYTQRLLSMPNIVALIPARGGSKRVPRKNIRMLAGYPLLAYTIAAARQAGIFSGVYVSTEDAITAQIATDYGAEIIDRPAKFATDASPDIEWVQHALGTLRSRPHAFALLRPTSPFRMPETIRNAWRIFCELESEGYESLRAVEPVRQHPYKMWMENGDRMHPFMPESFVHDYHSRPTQSLLPVLVQNASLEIALTRITECGTITGRNVIPFFMPEYEGFDINTELDWMLAEMLVERGLAKLLEVGNV